MKFCVVISHDIVQTTPCPSYSGGELVRLLISPPKLGGVRGGLNNST